MNPVRIFAAFLTFAAALPLSAQKPADDRMSPMGRLAQQKIQNATLQSGAGARALPRARVDCADGNLRCYPQGLTSGPAGGQAEVSIAVDSTGQHIVMGFNDARGLSRDPVSVSGFMYSDDGGATFTDGGQLPSPGNQFFAAEKYPQIYGDPDVKYLGACTFIYASILVRVAGNALVQTMGIHRSTDCGHTWTGPVEVTPATNPNGQVDVNGNPLDTADKELMDVDPETGRVVMGWSNFTSLATSGVEISVTYTDNILSPNPTFAPRRVIAASNGDGQGSSVRFAGNGSSNAYIAWTRFRDFYTRRIALSRSTDNGQTWSAPAEITPTFVRMDQVLGNDRSNEYPSLAVDKSSGPYSGYVYVVFSNNNTLDGADVYFSRSTNGGVTFSAPVILNSSPGSDRPQWFPYVVADRQTGRVHVFYYDQGVDTSGHLTQVSYQYSDDGGTTWTRPAALSERTFKAGWGNTTSQPNLGDYNQAIAQFGTFYAGYAATTPQRFKDGQPTTELITPDVYFSKVTAGTLKLPVIAGAASFTDSGGNGNLDPGETAAFTMKIRNPGTNPLFAGTLSGVTALLSTTTPGVTIMQPSSAYANIAAGATAQNTTPFQVALAPTFVPGTEITFRLAVTGTTGTAVLEYRQPTGTLLKTTLLSEDFDSVAAGSLPAGWLSFHGAGENYVPWITSRSFCGSSNKAFHQNANDALNDPARWERLFSPVLQIPSNAQWVELEFDVCYDTEEDRVLQYTAYDGFFLRVTDLTPGRLLRSVLAEAFEEEFTTGLVKHYPRHLPRSSHPYYFEDMSAWGGNSGGAQKVKMRLPGMAGSTVQFRFEFTQDTGFTCADLRPGHTCGVAVDNFVVRSVRAVASPKVNLIASAQLSREASNNITARVTVRNAGSEAATNVRLTGAVLGTTAATGIPQPVASIPAGGSTVITLTFPAAAGSAGQASALRLTGVYDGGTWGGNLRVTIP